MTLIIQFAKFHIDISKTEGLMNDYDKDIIRFILNKDISKNFHIISYMIPRTAQITANKIHCFKLCSINSNRNLCYKKKNFFLSFKCISSIFISICVYICEKN